MFASAVPAMRRLALVWQGEHKRWQGRDLSAKRYVYVWADGNYFSPRLEHERQSIPVLTGAAEAFDRFVAKYGADFEKARTCVVKDRDVLLAFYDFPAEHWQHVRSTNPIENTFATVRLRTSKTRGCLSRDTALAMVFKLVKSAERP